MSSINGLGGTTSVNLLANPYRLYGATSPSHSAPTRGSDSVELSTDSVNRFLNVIKSTDARADKVASVRAALEAGTYETDDKLDVAVDRLLEDLA